jgi:hypothetical protein
MKILTVYGGSDDLIETEGLPGCDEFNVYPKSVYVEELLITSKEGCIGIHVIYDGSWCFAVSAKDGDCDEMPNWKMTRTFGQDTRYSETLTIECPDDAVLTRAKKIEED